MKKLICALLVAGSLAAFSLPAAAAPPGQVLRGGDPYLCDELGEVLIFGGNGRSGWIGDTLYVATEANFTGTFTPVDGDPEVFEFSKVWGNGPAGDLIRCTAHFEGSDETGSFVGDTEVWAKKVPRR